MSDKKPWGMIHHTDGEIEDTEDPVDILIKEQDRIRRERPPPNIPLNEWRRDKEKRMADKEKELWDLIYLQRMKRGLRRREI